MFKATVTSYIYEDVYTEKTDLFSRTPRLVRMTRCVAVKGVGMSRSPRAAWAKAQQTIDRKTRYEREFLRFEKLQRV